MKPLENQFQRAALVVLDSVGIGEMPDAARFRRRGLRTRSVTSSRRVK